MSRTIIAHANFTFDRRYRSPICSHAGTRAPFTCYLPRYLIALQQCRRARSIPLPPTLPLPFFIQTPRSRSTRSKKTEEQTKERERKGRRTTRVLLSNAMWLGFRSCPCTPHTYPKFPYSWMNFLVWNRLCFPFLPLVVRRTHVQYGELRVRVSIVCPLLLSLSYSVHVSVCTSSRGGLNGFPTWSIVSRSLPFHPLTLPRPPIHPIPTRFPLVVGCLWRRDVSSLPLYIAPKNEEREGDVRVLLPSLILLLLLFLSLPFLGCSTPPARSNPKIDLRRIHAPPVF